MRYKVFIDTNILLSGIFFEGNESRIFDDDDLYKKPRLPGIGVFLTAHEKNSLENGFYFR